MSSAIYFRPHCVNWLYKTGTIYLIYTFSHNKNECFFSYKLEIYLSYKTMHMIIVNSPHIEFPVEHTGHNFTTVH